MNSIHRKLYISLAKEYCHDPSNDGERAFLKGKFRQGKETRLKKQAQELQRKVCVNGKVKDCALMKGSVT